MFPDAEFDGQFLRLIDTIPSQGADFGEAFITARQIPSGDTSAWYDAWFALGERTERLAQECADAGNTASARDAFLRALTYFRTAGIFLFKPPVSEPFTVAMDRQRDAFVKAMALFAHPGEAIEIPYESTTLPGYLLLPSSESGPFPLVVITGGYDGTKEECFLAGGAEALDRGYACLLFDGPGQGEALLHQDLFFRPDWEHVVTPVVDYAISRPEIDKDRIALLGRSWGGYLAPRAATAEHRLTAVIADAAQYAPGKQALAFFPPEYREAFAAGTYDAELNAGLEQAMAADASLAFTLNRGMLTHGVPTPIAYLHALQDYTLVGLADRITCPALICAAEDDSRGADAKQLFDAIQAPKDYILFRNADGAGEHCEAGAASLFAARMFTWLDPLVAG